MKHWNIITLNKKGELGLGILSFILMDPLGCAVFLSAGSDYEFVAILHPKHSVHLKNGTIFYS